MECPNCNKNVSELDEKCPNCGLDFESYEEKREDTGYVLSKTGFIKFINAMQLIGCVIIAFVNWSNEQGILGFTFFFSGFVLFAFIKGFTDIIDLLDSINDKLDNK